MSYVELQATSHFSFLRGASSCELLLEQARLFGLEALAIVDRNSLAGIVRAHEAAKASGVRLIVGCRLDLIDGTGVLVYPIDRPAYSRLTRLLSLGKRRAGKAKCPLDWSDLKDWSEGLIAILVPDEADEACAANLRRLKATFPAGSYLALTARADGAFRSVDDLWPRAGARVYVRGNTQQFYDWLDASPAGVPQRPPIWICGDCHLGNLGPFADVKGEVDVQIRALDQTVIGNPAHDIIRLGLSLASAARDSNLPGVATARMLEQLMQGYEQGLEMNPDDGSTDILKPPGDPNSVERSIKRRSFGTRAETAFLKFCYTCMARNRLRPAACSSQKRTESWPAPFEVIHPLCWSADRNGWSHRWPGSVTSPKRSSPSCARSKC